MISTFGLARRTGTYDVKNLNIQNLTANAKQKRQEQGCFVRQMRI